MTDHPEADYVTALHRARRNAERPEVAAAFVCADGFTLSVQASRYHYCQPRITRAERYTSFECGFPSVEEPLLTPYAEDPENLIETVYPQVPAHVVAAVLRKHGGVV